MYRQIMVDRLRAGGDLGERDTRRYGENDLFGGERNVYIRGVMSEVSARVGIRRSP